MTAFYFNILATFLNIIASGLLLIFANKLKNQCNNLITVKRLEAILPDNKLIEKYSFKNNLCEDQFSKKINKENNILRGSFAFEVIMLKKLITYDDDFIMELYHWWLKARGNKFVNFPYLLDIIGYLKENKKKGDPLNLPPNFCNSEHEKEFFQILEEYKILEDTSLEKKYKKQYTVPPVEDGTSYFESNHPFKGCSCLNTLYTPNDKGEPFKTEKEAILWHIKTFFPNI